MKILPEPPTITVPFLGEDEDNHVCSRPGCGNTAFDSIGGLTYITVTTRIGEEGYGEVTQALCEDHLTSMHHALVLLGFVSHNHHGTQPFEDAETCGAFYVPGCQTPCAYGPELVQPNEAPFNGR